MKVLALVDGVLTEVAVTGGGSYSGVPYYVPEDTVHTCPENTQELIATPVKVDGVYRVDGVRVFL